MKSNKTKNIDFENNKLIDSTRKDESINLLIKAVLTPSIFILFCIVEGISDNVPLAAIGFFFFICPFLFKIREMFFNEKLLVSLYHDFLYKKLQPLNRLIKLSFIILFITQFAGLIMILLYFLP